MFEMKFSFTYIFCPQKAERFQQLLLLSSLRQKWWISSLKKSAEMNLIEKSLLWSFMWWLQHKNCQVGPGPCPVLEGSAGFWLLSQFIWPMWLDQATISIPLGGQEQVTSYLAISGLVCTAHISAPCFCCSIICCNALLVKRGIRWNIMCWTSSPFSTIDQDMSQLTLDQDRAALTVTTSVLQIWPSVCMTPSFFNVLDDVPLHSWLSDHLCV